MFAMVLKVSYLHAFKALTHTSHCDTDPPLCRSIVCPLSSGWHWLDIPCWASEWRWRSVCLSTGPWADGHIARTNISVGHNRIMQEAHRCDVPSLSLDGGERSWLFHLSPQELMPRSDKFSICQRTCPSRSRDMLLERQQINNFILFKWLNSSPMRYHVYMTHFLQSETMLSIFMRVYNKAPEAS